MMNYLEEYDETDPISIETYAKRLDRKSVRVGKECRSRWSPYH